MLSKMHILAEMDLAYYPLQWLAVSNGMLAGILVLILIMVIACYVKISGNHKQEIEQIHAETSQLRARRDELETVLTSMVEAVIAVDRFENVISLNRAAASLFQSQSFEVIGKNLADVIHYPPLHKLVVNTLTGNGPMQVDLALAPEDDEDDDGEEVVRMFQAQGSKLKNAQGKAIGALIVLHDVTRLRRLELIRRDFVANASHEFKTPVAAIRASAETIIDDPDPEPSAVSKFLDIIVRQSSRLQAIVEDLLALARIEDETDKDNLSFDNLPVNKIVKSAVEACEHHAESKGTVVEIDCQTSIMINANNTLIEQALVNLINNAINYSPKESHVLVRVDKGEDELVINVIDNGPGIAEEHLSRIFERFYRTDKARSRGVGGTGLGLAIVKHVAAAHGGRVSVESKVGVGSTFKIHIPHG